MKPTLFLPILMFVALTGCGERPAMPDNASTASAAPAASGPTPLPPPPGPATARVWFVPDALEDCTPPLDQVVTIHWDASKSSARSVDIKISGGDGTEGLFASGALTSSKPSGPWMRPGSLVLVRDHDTSVELGRAVAAAKPCAR